MIESLLTRSLENPSTTLDDPADWLIGALGGGKSSSGVPVSRKSALMISALWRGVNLIATSIAKVPLYVYIRTADGKVRDKENPAYRLLLRESGPFFHAFSLKQLLSQHALMVGNGYAYIVRDMAARPVQLVPLDPNRTTPYRYEGRVWYRHETNDGAAETIAAENILHIKGFGWDGLKGYSLVEYGVNSLGLNLGATEYSGKFFSNGATPASILQHPENISKEAAQRLRESWNANQGGLSNSHKIAILEEGMELKPIGMSARDAQLIELRQFEVKEVANWLSLPPHKLGDDAKTSYASLEQENQSFLDEALDGWFVTWESETWLKLLTEEQKADDSRVIEFLRQALVRADIKSRGEFYKTALAGAPWMTIDGVRALENMAPLNDERTDTLQFPSNNFGTDNDDASGAARADLEAQIERMSRRLMADAARADNIDDWLATVDEKHGHIIDSALGPPARVLERLTEEKDVLVRTRKALLKEVSDHEKQARA